MKKRILLLALAAMMLVSSCGKPKDNLDAQNNLYAVEPEEEVDPYYAEMKEKEHVRPIAVMIDNDSEKPAHKLGWKTHIWYMKLWWRDSPPALWLYLKTMAWKKSALFALRAITF